MEANDNITLNINKRVGKIILCVVAAIIALGFIPSEQEISMPGYEETKTYTSATSYSYKVYSPYGGAATGLKADILLLSNGPCNSELDYRTNTIVSECDNFYIKSGNLYERLNTEAHVYEEGGSKEYQATYTGKIDVKITSGSTIQVETYYTKKCHAFGFICSSGEMFEAGTGIHTRLVIGKNANIKRYNTICDGRSDKPLLDEDSCIYADDTYKNTTIDSLLKI